MASFYAQLDLRLYSIVKAAPKAKRLNIGENVNRDSSNWRFNDSDDYSQKLGYEFGDILCSCISDGIDNGAEIGEEILGIPGMIIGGVIGGVTGTISGFFEEFAS